MKRLLAFLALCLPIYLFSQGFGSFTHDQPYLAKDTAAGSSGPDGALPVGIGYRWVASDLSNSPVATWTDRIQGLQWVQASAGNRPTWTTNGVRFTAASSQYMTTNAAGPGATFKLGNSVATSGDTLLMILDRASTGEQYILAPSAGGVIFGFTGANAWYNIGVPFGSTTTGVWYDYLHAGTNSDSGQLNAYTNGVVFNGNVPLLASPIHNLGRLFSPTCCYFDGTIKEIIVWTNVVKFSSVQASNIHWYSTNVYGYSP